MNVLPKMPSVNHGIRLPKIVIKLVENSVNSLIKPFVLRLYEIKVTEVNKQTVIFGYN